jgi:hypothetical protein
MLPLITGLQVVRFASAAPMYGVDGRPHVGSPRINASYVAKSAAVLSAHCAGDATSTAWPAATAACASLLDVPPVTDVLSISTVPAVAADASVAAIAATLVVRSAALRNALMVLVITLIPSQSFVPTRTVRKAALKYTEVVAGST